MKQAIPDPVNPGNAPRRFRLLLLPLFLLTLTNVLGQTTWDGSESTDWNIVANWSAGIPDASDDVIIPDVTNDPIITAGTAALAKSLFVQTGASLTINATGSLTINGNANYNTPFTFDYTTSLNNLGTLANNGNLSLGSISSAGAYAIVNQGNFNNNTGGEIHIDNSTNTGIYNAFGTFTNASLISIGATATVGFHGIWNDATFHNNEGGSISIDRSSSRGLVNNFDETKSIEATFNNLATINIGVAQNVGNNGIRNLGIFNNKGDGDILIDHSSVQGLYNGGDATFTNEASVKIRGLGNFMNYGLENDGIFNNNMGGNINIDNSQGKALYNAAGTFTNAANITIGATASVGTFGLVNRSSFDNNAGGDIKIDNSTDTGLYQEAGTFNNLAKITIGTTANVGVHGIFNQSTFNNNTGGDISINRTANYGLRNFNGTINNAAKITIGATQSVGNHGMYNQSIFNNNAGGDIRIDNATEYGLRNFSGTFTNAATIKIGAIASVGQYGICNQSAFGNNTGGQIHVDNASSGGVYLWAGTFNNAGTVTVGEIVQQPTLMNFNISEANAFNNNTGGTIKGTGSILTANLIHAGGTLSPGYSPGIINFNGHRNFGNSIMAMEINGPGTAGVDFDQITVPFSATLGGTLAVSINYTPADGDEVTILTAAPVIGTFSSVTGLPAKWSVIYSANAVKLVYSNALPVTLVEFSLRATEKTVRLQWRTATETNNQGFGIQQSSNGTNWKEISFVDGNGTISQKHDYTFVDDNPTPGINYYRLRQLDFDGKTEYSRVRSVNFDNAALGLVVWADANQQAHIETGDVIQEVTVLNTSGRVLGIFSEGFMDLSEMPTGILLFQVRTNRGTSTKKLLNL